MWVQESKREKNCCQDEEKDCRGRAKKEEVTAMGLKKICEEPRENFEIHNKSLKIVLEF